MKGSPSSLSRTFISQSRRILWHRQQHCLRSEVAESAQLLTGLVLHVIDMRLRVLTLVRSRIMRPG
ncbi:uncharacterized protein CLUP02_01879 [Colletotrichum lupini]|uniref:Uncharacterized protein n=3 Tax=Colletotrichum acutatum species complex TaxID=2707335 RepID=A0A9Q8SD64_9PEZI|nr:uncharacterized protein CLUP02_01879 [Colletotrichum lupini]XP_060318011.1 uncharacterized protein CCOS01_03560 [Colletotrichum costaricense]XP_060375489.1 uncharacterized protein CTAM01_13904 [Colletotrichum tamarilloi]KAK1481656.1 hypothetical protein CTAM01_13904 [Colletotrichum tamarilloi]KAK1534808.1 hypothetical protein CCOS01_03560 [Colletotrichum costaricense]KAK1712123.1 hypothetical protein BDP67DRAFT_62033 [Colletotrichum lupini]UQC75226.1 hypothetical protein CLUP02_01879 [Coll